MKTLNYIILISLFVSSCAGESDKTEACPKLWEVQINNPEAIVKIEDGLLIIDIPNPKISSDVRLIQRQTQYYPNPGVNLYLKYRNLTTEYSAGDKLHDGMVSAWYAYDYEPDNLVVGARAGSFGSRLEFNNEYRAFFVEGGTFSTAGKIEFEAQSTLRAGIELDTEVGGLGYYEPNYQLQTDPMVFYLDFGIYNIFPRELKSDRVRVEIEELTFRSGNTAEINELIGDFFDCNSLQN